MCFQASRVALRPQLVQIVPKAQKEKLCKDMGPAPGEKALESAVAFQYAESAFNLNGPIDPKHNPLFTRNILL